MIFQHPDYVQSFDKDRLVFADDLRRELLKHIPSGVTDFGVQSRHPESGLCPIITILDLTRQPTLKYPQSLFILNERARIFDLLAIAGRSKRLNTNVYADFGPSLPERFDLGFYKDADKIASTAEPRPKENPGNISTLDTATAPIIISPSARTGWPVRNAHSMCPRNRAGRKCWRRRPTYNAC
jgi:hypothetical protein